VTLQKRDWHELCEAASNEYDSEQLRVLISELVKTFDERDTGANRVAGNERFDAA